MLEDDGFVKISAIMRCAVYALVKNGEVVYIGKSKKPFNRLKDHIEMRKVRQVDLYGRPAAPRISFDDVWILGCMLGQLDDLERRMIKKYRPKYNVVHNPDRKADRGPITIPEDIMALLATLAPELPSSKDNFRAPVGPYMIRRL